MCCDFAECKSTVVDAVEVDSRLRDVRLYGDGALCKVENEGRSVVGGGADDRIVAAAQMVDLMEEGGSPRVGNGRLNVAQDRRTACREAEVTGRGCGGMDRAWKYATRTVAVVAAGAGVESEDLTLPQSRVGRKDRVSVGRRSRSCGADLDLSSRRLSDEIVWFLQNAAG